MRQIIFILLLILGLAVPVEASEIRTVSAHGRIFKLSPPQGFCFLDTRLDRELINYMTKVLPKNILVFGMFYKCEVVRQMRLGQVASDLNPAFGYYSTFKDARSAVIRTSRSVFIQKIVKSLGNVNRDKIEKFITDEVDTLSKRGDLSSLGLTPGRPVFIGLLGSDRNAVYTGTILNLIDDGKPKVIASVLAVIVAKATRVHLAISDKYIRGHTFDVLKKIAIEEANKITELNRD